MPGGKIEGMEEALRALDRSPEVLLKGTKSAMTTAARQTLRMVQGRMPERWRRLLRSKVGTGWDGHTTARLGLFNTGDGDAKSLDWFKAYWSNYGTLRRRDPMHHFDTPVRQRRPSRRNNTGQPAIHFFEAAMEGADNKFTEVFEAEIDKLTDSLI